MFRNPMECRVRRIYRPNNTIFAALFVNMSVCVCCDGVRGIERAQDRYGHGLSERWNKRSAEVWITLSVRKQEKCLTKEKKQQPKCHDDASRIVSRPRATNGPTECNRLTQLGRSFVEVITYLYRNSKYSYLYTPADWVPNSRANIY